MAKRNHSAKFDTQKKIMSVISNLSFQASNVLSVGTVVALCESVSKRSPINFSNRQVNEMTTLSVKDLPESKELDGNTMAGVVGALYTTPWYPYPGQCYPCRYPIFYRQHEYAYEGYTGFHMELDYENWVSWSETETVMVNV